MSERSANYENTCRNLNSLNADLQEGLKEELAEEFSDACENNGTVSGFVGMREQKKIINQQTWKGLDYFPAIQRCEGMRNDYFAER